MAPAKTGNDNRRSKAVIKTDQTNSGIRSNVIDDGRMLMIVVMKLIAPKIDEIPAKCKEKIPKSTAPPGWAIFLESGGYTVQPVPTPALVNDDINRRVKEGGSNQNLMLFIRGKAISGALIIMGINQFPKPPIIIGITMKKIITKA
jgi:hypothetical protein